MKNTNNFSFKQQLPPSSSHERARLLETRETFRVLHTKREKNKNDEFVVVKLYQKS